VNVRDTRFLYMETYVIDAPSDVGDRFTTSLSGFTAYDKQLGLEYAVGMAAAGAPFTMCSTEMERICK
jgi:hypothetical protein